MHESTTVSGGMSNIDRSGDIHPHGFTEGRLRCHKRGKVDDGTVTLRRTSEEFSVSDVASD